MEVAERAEVVAAADYSVEQGLGKAVAGCSAAVRVVEVKVLVTLELKKSVSVRSICLPRISLDISENDF